METSTKEMSFASALGAIVGLVYTIGQTVWWGSGSYDELTLAGLLSSAAIGAVAGVLAFEIRRRT